MSKINRKRRQFEIKKRRKRREKIKKLKMSYFLAGDQKEKEKILKRLEKYLSYSDILKFLESLKK